MKKIIQQIEEVKSLLLLQAKEVLTLKEFCLYTGFSPPYTYRLIANKALPYYKPSGKSIFFKKEDIIEYLTSIKIDNETSKQKKVSTFLLKKNKL